MAVGVLRAAPEFTKQIYDDVTEKMFGHASPCGKTRRRRGWSSTAPVRASRATTSTTSGSRARPSSASWRRSSAGARRGHGRPAARSGEPQYFPIDVLVAPHW